MKNLLFVAAAAVAGYCLFSEAQPIPLKAQNVDRKDTSKSFKSVASPETRSNFLAKTGGFLTMPCKGGHLLFLNAQTAVEADSLRKVGATVQQYFRLSVALKSVPSDAPVRVALEALDDTNTAAVVVIGDSAGYPALLVAPESRWAMVNVAALGGKDVSAELLTDRTCKEVWRAFGYLMGAAHSNIENCLLKPVLNPSDLDTLSSKTLSPEPLNKIMLTAKKLGMHPFQTTTYRKAVEEGWAPKPTNAVQQAIWDELKK